MAGLRLFRIELCNGRANQDCILKLRVSDIRRLARSTVSKNHNLTLNTFSVLLKSANVLLFIKYTLDSSVNKRLLNSVIAMIYGLAKQINGLSA